MSVKFNLIFIFVLCASSVYSATSVSRWFSSTYHDLRVTMRRYGHCTGGLSPLRDTRHNETEFLISQIRGFLDQGSYDNEQLLNVSHLMDNICRSDLDSSYPISVNIDVTKYNSNNETGKENRCKAIDEAMDAMFGVFKKASFNKTEPLDFSVIQFYPHPENKAASYNLTDLINTSWIKSETILEHVCKITDSVKEYVAARTSNSTAQDRSQQQPAGFFSSLLDMLDRMLDPILGLQRRFYWETNNRFEQVYLGVSNQFANLRDALGSRVKSTRDRITGRAHNSTVVTNATNTTTAPSGSSTVVPSSMSANWINSTRSTAQPAVSLNKTLPSSSSS